MMSDFDRSSQARSWLFDTDTLSKCREQCVAWEDAGAAKKVRKFASGFYRRAKSENLQSSHGRNEGPSTTEPTPLSNNPPDPAVCLSSDEHERIVRFHANQIPSLIGPYALLPELRRSNSMLATAVMLFRRYFLSNTVLSKHHPRKVATAAAFLASKVEENRCQLDHLSYATRLIWSNKASCYGDELPAISVEEIREAEKALLEGLNYELICSHPFDALRVLACDLSDFFSHAHSSDVVSDHARTLARDVHHRAVSMTHRALIYSDAPFLFAPGRIAFAAAAIALRSVRCEGLNGFELEEFLRFRFPSRSEGTLYAFEQDIVRVMDCLTSCPQMQLGSNSHISTWNEEKKLWYAVRKTASIRSFHPPAGTATSATKSRVHKKAVQSKCSLPRKQPLWVNHTSSRKCAAVTPISSSLS